MFQVIVHLLVNHAVQSIGERQQQREVVRNAHHTELAVCLQRLLCQQPPVVFRYRHGRYHGMLLISGGRFQVALHVSEVMVGNKRWEQVAVFPGIVLAIMLLHAPQIRGRHIFVGVDGIIDSSCIDICFVALQTTAKEVDRIRHRFECGSEQTHHWFVLVVIEVRVACFPQQLLKYAIRFVVVRGPLVPFVDDDTHLSALHEVERVVCRVHGRVVRVVLRPDGT